MLLSVVVCTYNREDYLKKCLECIVNSTLDKSLYEVLVIDNNSVDKTGEVVESYRKLADNIFYFQEHQQGLSFARNRAIKEARGKYLLYLDDDALVNEEGLEALNKFLSENAGVAIVGGRSFIEYESKKPDWLTKKSEDWIGAYDFGEEILVVNKNYRKKLVRYPIGACFCVEKEFLASIGGFDSKLGRIGKKMLAGEETLVNFWAEKKQRLIIYFPNIFVRHLIQPERLSIDSFFIMTFYNGVSDYLIRTRVHSFLRRFGFSLFRVVFLFKNILEYCFYSLVRNKDKAFDSRFLMNFNFGYVVALFGFCKNG